MVEEGMGEVWNSLTVNDLINAQGVYLISEVQAGAFNG